VDGLVLCLYDGPLMFTKFHYKWKFHFTKWVQESGNGDHKEVSLKTIDCRHRPNFMQVSRGYQKSSLKEDVMLKTLKSIGFTLDLLESVQIKNHLYLSNFDTCLSNNQLVLKFSFWQIEYSWNFNTFPSQNFVL